MRERERERERERKRSLTLIFSIANDVADDKESRYLINIIMNENN